MNGFWIVGVLMLLSLGAGLLVGTSWNIHVLDQRYRRLAIERRELNEWRRALQEARYVWCANLTASRSETAKSDVSLRERVANRH